jgi:hypothetical protein
MRVLMNSSRVARTMLLIPLSAHFVLSPAFAENSLDRYEACSVENRARELQVSTHSNCRWNSAITTASEIEADFGEQIVTGENATIPPDAHVDRQQSPGDMDSHLNRPGDCARSFEPSHTDLPDGLCWTAYPPLPADAASLNSDKFGGSFTTDVNRIASRYGERAAAALVEVRTQYGLAVYKEFRDLYDCYDSDVVESVRSFYLPRIAESCRELQSQTDALRAVAAALNAIEYRQGTCCQSLIALGNKRIQSGDCTTTVAKQISEWIEEHAPYLHETQLASTTAGRVAFMLALNNLLPIVTEVRLVPDSKGEFVTCQEIVSGRNYTGTRASAILELVALVEMQHSYRDDPGSFELTARSIASVIDRACGEPWHSGTSPLMGALGTAGVWFRVLQSI